MLFGLNETHWLSDIYKNAIGSSAACLPQARQSRVVGYCHTCTSFENNKKRGAGFYSTEVAL